MSHIDPDIATKIREAKSLARSNRSRRNVILLAGCLCGIFSAVAWGVLAPDSPPEWESRFFLGTTLGMCAAMAFLHFFGARYMPVSASCPKCGYRWEIKEGSGVPYTEIMPYWDKCPGCGLLMGDELVELALVPFDLVAVERKTKRL